MVFHNLLIERVLLNILFVILPYCLFLFFIDRNKDFNWIKKYLLLPASALSIMFCMSFSIPLNNDFIIDFRSIPLAIAAIYGGPLSTVILVLITLVYRFIIGGLGIVPTFIQCVFFFLLSFIIEYKYNVLLSKKRMIISILFVNLTWSFSFIFMAGSNIYFPYQASTYIAFLFLLSTVTFLVVYINEFFQKSIILQNKMIKAEKMEVVSHLASSISHEIRNPLTAVRGFLQLLSMDLPNDKKDEFLKISIEELDRAESIIRDYLTYAKPSFDSIEVINAKIAMESVIKVIRPMANMHSVEIITNFEELYFFGDRHHFQQCFLNLTKNSIEAMRDGGMLTITINRVCNEIIIIIQDTGEGMTNEELSRLGEPYFTTKGAQGTGLGMMVVYRIIESFRGKITANSEKGIGTTFTIKLPIAEDKCKLEEIASQAV